MNIAVLGLGIIGRIWARNLMADGHAVRCWNRTPMAFPGICPSIAEAIADAEAIFIVVADPPAVQSVLDAMLPALQAGQIVIQSSTISAQWTLSFARQVEETGASYLEAPFTGSQPAAEQRQTVFYLGGDAALIDRTKPLLRTLAKAILAIGPLGSASSLKLAMNLQIAGIAQALCESISLARQTGIADEVYFEALALNVASSGLARLKEPKLRQQDYSPQFSLKHMAKDLRLALETGDLHAVSLPQTRQLLTQYEKGLAAGWQDEDFIGLLRLLEKPDAAANSAS